MEAGSVDRLRTVVENDDLMMYDIYRNRLWLGSVHHIHGTGILQPSGINLCS
jgi:hypothetical protein